MVIVWMQSCKYFKGGADNYSEHTYKGKNWKGRLINQWDRPRHWTHRHGISSLDLNQAPLLKLKLSHLKNLKEQWWKKTLKANYTESCERILFWGGTFQTSASSTGILLRLTSGWVVLFTKRYLDQSIMSVFWALQPFSVPPSNPQQYFCVISGISTQKPHKIFWDFTESAHRKYFSCSWLRLPFSFRQEFQLSSLHCALGSLKGTYPW